MDLAYTNNSRRFARSPAVAGGECAGAATLQSFDTAEGFAQHRVWEAKLNEGRWGMVTWPEEFGGRGCDLIDWLIFEEEYYRARAAAGQPERDFPAGPPDGVRHPRTEGAHPAKDGLRRGGLGPGLVRAQRRFRHGGHPRPGGPAR